jgi:signal transduction histidine kinase
MISLNFRTKVTLTTVTLIVLTALTIGATLFTRARQVLLSNQLSELGTNVEISGVRLVAGIDALRNDTIFLSRVPEVQGIRRAIEAGGTDPVDLTTDALWRTQLIGIFSELLSSKPHYVSVRYISAAQDGLELVRVDRTTDGIRVSGRRELRVGVSDEFFTQAQQLDNGSVYLSDIVLQRDDTQIVEPQTIVSYASTPIYSDDGSLFGVIVIAIDFSNVFDEMLALEGDNETLYVTNQSGDFLVNSVDPSLTFGFEFGESYRIQDSFEALGPLFETNSSLQELPATTRRGSNESALHFKKVAFDPLNSDRYLGIGVSTPYSEIVGEIDRFVNQGIAIAFGLVIVGAVIAVSIAQQLIRPLYQMADATQQISEGNFDVNMPADSDDEFGKLSRAFNQMASAVQERENALTQMNESLEKRVAERTVDLKKARDEAVAAQRLAQENSRLKSEFLSTMSHELRTPLNAIEGFTGIMLGGMGVELSDKAESMTKRVQANSRRLLHLINDFLDLSRIESGRLELVQADLSISELARKWERDVGILAEDKGLDFVVNVDPSLPSPILGDEDALTKIAVNLLSNAFKFTHKGSVRLDIQSEADHNWSINVIDTGIGIPSHARDYIFDEFRQVDGSSTRQYGGTGLGLSLVQKLSRALGGNVTLDSEVGEGSHFKVVLPLLVPEEVEVELEGMA